MPTSNTSTGNGNSRLMHHAATASRLPLTATLTTHPTSYSRMLLCAITAPACIATFQGGVVKDTFTCGCHPPEAMEACTAMKPLCLPISLTTPMPQRALLASTCTHPAAHTAPNMHSVTTKPT
jgi:hypothetical protein